MKNTMTSVEISDLGSPAAGYCIDHPDRETLLGCSKCGKPICPKCAIRHPVGLRCKECAQIKRSVLYAVRAREYGLAALVGLAVSAAAGVFVTFLTFFAGWFFFLIGIGAGGFIGDLMSRAIRYKRGRGLQTLAGICIFLGALLGCVAEIRFLRGQGDIPIALLYATLATAGAVKRLH